MFTLPNAQQSTENPVCLLMRSSSTDQIRKDLSRVDFQRSLRAKRARTGLRSKDPCTAWKATRLDKASAPRQRQDQSDQFPPIRADLLNRWWSWANIPIVPHALFFSALSTEY